MSALGGISMLIAFLISVYFFVFYKKTKPNGKKCEKCGGDIVEKYDLFGNTTYESWCSVDKNHYYTPEFFME